MSSDSQPNWLDRAISYLAPEWGLRRAAARTALQMSFRGGVASRVERPFGSFGGVTGQTQRDRMQLEQMRNRARAADRNNAIAHAILNRLVDNVVGEGFRLAANTTNAEFNRRAEDLFAEDAERFDIRGLLSWAELQRHWYRCHERDGDVGVILVDRAGASRLQLIGGERIRTPHGAPPLDASTTIVDGVELDRVGRPVRFHVLDAPEHERTTYTAIAANNFVYFPRIENYDQVRGQPCFAQVFPLLDQLDGYVEAVVIAARMAAVFGLVFKGTGQTSQLPRLGLAANGQGQQQRVITLENGQIKFVGQDDEVFQVDAKQPMTQTPEFIAALLRMIGNAVDMPLEIVALNMAQANFSSARIGLIQFYRAMRAKQSAFASHLSRVYRWWVSRAVNAGRFDDVRGGIPVDYWKHKFIAQGWSYTDPVSEAQADLLQVSMGAASIRDVCSKLGRDFDEIVATNAADFAAMRAVGLPPLVSTLTRDSQTKVTAVDADGNPLPATQTLNGVQLTAALEVLSKLVEKTMTPTAAETLLVSLGIPEDRAKAMTAEAVARTDVAPGDLSFRRQVLLQMLNVPQAREAVYNLTDMEDLVAQTGLPAEAGYQAPYAAVVAPTGPLNSGATIRDPEGDIVGADVENDLPADANGRNASTATQRED